MVLRKPAVKPRARNGGKYAGWMKREIPRVDAPTIQRFVERWMREKTPEHVIRQEIARLKSRIRYGEEIVDAFKPKKN